MFGFNGFVDFDDVKLHLIQDIVDPAAGERAAAFTPEDLETLEPGLAAYMKRWFDEQRILWGATNPMRDQAVRGLLNLCASALGPLSREDVLALAPEGVEDAFAVLQSRGGRGALVDGTSPKT
mgnify:CR=1 FL=1